MNDRIEKRIELKAPVARVWRALTDYREFGEWFRVKIEAPFVPGEASHGRLTYPGYEHAQMAGGHRENGARRNSSPSHGIPMPSIPTRTTRRRRRRSSSSGWRRPRPAHCSSSPSPGSTRCQPSAAARHFA